MSFARQTLGCFVAASLLLAACRPVEPIAEYTVETSESVDSTLASNQPAEAQPSQTLGAMLAVDGTGWFFKLVGDPTLVAPQREAFEAFVKGLKFEGGEPQWTLPAGWTARPGSGIRFATIEVSTSGSPQSGPLELTVIPLPQGDATAEQFVLSNVNRWRDQVGLPPITAQDLAKHTETFKVGDYDCTLVDVVGTSQGGGMGAAPFAPFAGGPKAGSGGDKSTQGPAPDDKSSRAAEAGADGELAYDKPAGWTQGQQNQFSKLAFNVTDGDQSAQLTVTQLGPGAGDVLANVNRWRGQVGLEPTTAAALANASEPIKTLGTAGLLVQLAGPESPGRKAMLGVIASTPESVWFVKLMGDHDLVLKERHNFESFTKSLQTK